MRSIYNQRKVLHQRQSGYLLIMTLIFSSVLLTIVTSIIGFAVVQSRVITAKIHYEQAGHIAEAGLNYYKWYLAHHPNDMTHGTGAPGPYVFTYYDPEGEAIGEYALDVQSTQFCGETNSVRVESVGHTYANPAIKRKISARYARPSVADYAFILNSSVWAGPDRVITGPYHSNGGIRMDGRNDSTVTSNLAFWSCNSSFGCTPTVNHNGVFTTTSNANPALFSFPSPPVDFSGITVDLTNLKQRALTGGGHYFPRVTQGNGNGNNDRFGYRVTFNTNGTVSVRRVNGTVNYWGYSSEEGWQQERNVVNNTNSIETFTPSPTCPVLFFEDKVWLEGEVHGKVTVVAANLINSAIQESIILNGSITYSSATSSGLLAIAQKDILIGLNVPDTMYINGVYIAQNGRYGRNMYCQNSSNVNCPNNRVLPGNYQQFAIRNHEIMNGTIVSNGRVGTQWISGNTTLSGFLNRTNNYDRLLATDPPPFTPVTSDVYQFHEWRDGD
jgi:hypothetical protein